MNHVPTDPAALFAKAFAEDKHPRDHGKFARQERRAAKLTAHRDKSQQSTEDHVSAVAQTARGPALTALAHAAPHAVHAAKAGTRAEMARHVVAAGKAADTGASEELEGLAQRLAKGAHPDLADDIRDRVRDALKSDHGEAFGELADAIKDGELSRPEAVQALHALLAKTADPSHHATELAEQLGVPGDDHGSLVDALGDWPGVETDRADAGSVAADYRAAGVPVPDPAPGEHGIDYGERDDVQAALEQARHAVAERAVRAAWARSGLDHTEGAIGRTENDLLTAKIRKQPHPVHDHPAVQRLRAAGIHPDILSRRFLAEIHHNKPEALGMVDALIASAQQHKAFSEDKVKRDHGKFARKPGAGGGSAAPRGPAGVWHAFASEPDPVAKDFLASALHNAGAHDPETRTKLPKGIDAHRLAERLASVYQQAHEEGKHDVAEVVAAALAHVGGAVPHAAGDTVAFDGLLHTSDDSLFTGDAATVVTPGVYAADGRELARAKVRAGSAVAKSLFAALAARYGADPLAALLASEPVDAEEREEGAPDIRKSLFAALADRYDAPVAKAWDESKHPRDDHGHFVELHAIEAAKGDKKKAAALRKKVTDPKQREKLDAALAAPKDAEIEKEEAKKPESKEDTAARVQAWLDAQDAGAAAESAARGPVSADISKDEHAAALGKVSDGAKRLIAQSHDWEKTQPWSMTAEQVKNGEAPGFEAGSYGGRNKETAHYHDGKIRLTPNYFALSDEEGRRHVVYHELGHELSDTMLADGTAFRLKDAGALPKELNGETTPGEQLAEAYGILHSDPTYLKKNAPGMIRPLVDRARALGMPVPKEFEQEQSHGGGSESGDGGVGQVRGDHAAASGDGGEGAGVGGLEHARLRETVDGADGGEPANGAVRGLDGNAVKPSRAVAGTVDLDATHKLAASLSGLSGERKKAALAKLADRLQGHTAAELKQLKDRLGLKASGPKAELARKLAERAANPDRSNLRHYAPAEGRLTVDAAHELIAGHLDSGRMGDPKVRREVADAIEGRMTVKDLHELKARLGLKASGPKYELAKKIADRAKAKEPLPKTVQVKIKKQRGRSSSDSVIQAVIDFGGIDPKKYDFQKFYATHRDAINDGIPLQVFRSGGADLEEIAKQLHGDGNGLVPTPHGKDPSEHLLDQIRQRAHTTAADLSSKYDEALNEHWRLEQDAHDAGHAPDRIAEAARLGQEAGASEGAAGLVGEDREGAVYGHPEETGGGISWDDEPAEHFEPDPYDHALANHSPHLEDIDRGSSGYVGGHLVRRTQEGQFQVETPTGYKVLSRAEASAHINAAWTKQSRERNAVTAALARADSHEEPDPFTNPVESREAAARRGEIPDGARGVSLDAHTRGRTGIVKRDAATGATRLVLDGGEEAKAQNFEPLHAGHSWRTPHLAQAAARRSVQGGLFDDEPAAVSAPAPVPKSPGGMDKYTREKEKAGVAEARARAKAEAGELFSNEQDNLFNTPDDPPAGALPVDPEAGSAPAAPEKTSLEWNKSANGDHTATAGGQTYHLKRHGGKYELHVNGKRQTAQKVPLAAGQNLAAVMHQSALRDSPPVAATPAFNPDSAIKIAADDITKLRKPDVFRVLDWAPAEHREALASHIVGNRPDLKAEVGDVMSELAPALPVDPEAASAQATAPVARPAGGLADLPPGVRDQLQGHVSRLNDHAANLGRARDLDTKLRGEGRYEHEVHEKIDASGAHKFLGEFRKLAASNGIDADRAIKEAGGVPDLSISPAGQSWRNDLAASAADKGRRAAANAPAVNTPAPASESAPSRPRELSDQEKSQQALSERAAKGDPDALATMVSDTENFLQRLHGGHYDDELTPEKKERTIAHYEKELEANKRDLEAERGRTKVFRKEIERKLLDHLIDNEGQFTADQLGEAVGMTRGHVRGILEDLARAGKMHRNPDLKTGALTYSMDEPPKPKRKPPK